MDFNVSFLRKDEDKVMHQMRTKTGTVAFSAPEIFTQNVYDEKVDIWSAGIVLYMMLSGKQPYESERMA
jgi:serine/threonine protein kinase